MTEQTLPTRYRLQYSRGPELRYVSHLDMQLVWERTFRRAHLPVAFSQGFSPRPRFHMASALPLGFTSRCEVADVWLTITTDPEDIQQRLQASSPPGFMIHSVAQVDYNLPALQTLVRSAEFIVTLRQLPEGYDLSREVEKLLALPEILRTRREKVYDLRALILEIEVLPAANPAAYPGLRMQLSAREGATGRPEEVLDALGLDPATTRVEKIAMELSQTSPA